MRFHLLLAAVAAATASAFVVPTGARPAARAAMTTMSASSIYDFTVKDAAGKDFSLSKLKDKKAVLVVNVASQCGMTPQYSELQALQDKYASKGFTVLAFPCNQFGGQEPGTAAQVCEFAKSRFQATFPIMDKIDVNGKNESPVYTFLKEKKGGLLGKDIKWNFSKFLIDSSGAPVKRYGPTDTPMSFAKDIEAVLSK